MPIDSDHWIPIQFWFSRYTGLSLSFIAIPWDDNDRDEDLFIDRLFSDNIDAMNKK
jgi:hypothetical protein